MIRTLLMILSVGLAAYAVYAFYYYSIQRTILYPRHVVDVPALIDESERDFEIVWLEMEWGQVEVWFLPPFSYPESGRAPVMVFAHANAELIDYWPDAVRELQRQGMGVLLVEFPGYGRSEGSPTQKTIAKCFVAAYDWLIQRDDVEPERIVIFGRSLGGGVACALAAKRPSRALILMSTFTSVRSMLKRHMLPGFLALDPFDNLSVVKRYENPILVLHGRYDEILPYDHGVKLADAAPDAELITLNCGHNDCVENWTEFWGMVEPFLREAGALP